MKEKLGDCALPVSARQTIMNDSNLIYIAGSQRSGSTLLDLLLGNHPDVTGTGEIHGISVNPDTRLCSCGVLISRCPYWQKIEKAYARNLNVDIHTVWENYPVTVLAPRTGRHFPTATEIGLVLGCRTLLPMLGRVSIRVESHLQMARNSWTLVDSIAMLEATRYVVDSTKNAARLGLLFLERPNNLKVIHLVRDGRAVTASLRRRLGMSVAKAAVHWKNANRSVTMVLRTIPSQQRYVLKYEDLCDETEQEMQSVCSFLGLGYFPGTSRLDYCNVHRIPGSPMLFQKNREIIEDVRWKTELSEVDLQNFERIAGSLNRRLGYG
jgi:hypothetical protein